MTSRLRQLRRKRGATNTMQLAHPDSGVPLAHNAKYLHNFFCKDSVQGVNFVDQGRGSIVMDTTGWGSGTPSPEPRVFNTNSDGSFSVGGGIAPGVYLDNISEGTWPQISAADDFIIIACVIAGVDTGEESSIWRIGSSPAMVRRHTTYDNGVGVGNIIGAVQDDDLNFAAELGEPISTNRPKLGDVLCTVTVVDRTANLLRSKVWNLTTGFEHILADADITGFGNISLLNKPDLNATKSAPSSFFGRYYGVAHYHFPNAGLPADYFGAAIQMANAWRNGNYTFWPPWGTE